MHNTTICLTLCNTNINLRSLLISVVLNIYPLAQKLKGCSSITKLTIQETIHQSLCILTYQISKIAKNIHHSALFELCTRNQTHSQLFIAIIYFLKTFGIQSWVDTQKQISSNHANLELLAIIRYNPTFPYPRKPPQQVLSSHEKKPAIETKIETKIAIRVVKPTSNNCKT